MADNPTYYQGELRRDLIDAAVAAIVTSGPAAVSLRSVAQSVGVSHAAPHKHFGDKAGLFAAVAVEGFEALAVAFERHVGAGDDPLLELGVAYVRHALDHPGHFAVMWVPELHGDAAAVADARRTAFGKLLAILNVIDGDLTESAAANARAERAWIVAHGMAALLLSGSLVPPPGTETLAYVANQLNHFVVT